MSRRLELGLRAVAFTLIGLSAWLALSPRPAPAATDSAMLPTALEQWSTTERPPSAHVSLSRPPTAIEREWLAALPGAGTRVTWSEGRGGWLPMAAIAEPIADPAGATVVRIAAPAGSAIALTDAAGEIDSVRAERGGATVTVPAAPDWVSASALGTAVRAAVDDSLVLKRVLVLARVGWEARFLIDALEEKGWGVDAHLALGPTRDIVVGAEHPIDTGSYAAVVVLDTSGARVAARVARYVRDGGGLVLASAAAGVDGWRAMLPEGSAPIAARRIGAGRVLRIGITDTWRQRMTADDGVVAHRAWWATVVSEAAYAPAVRRPPSRAADPVPLVGLIDRLGPATRSVPVPARALWGRPSLVFLLTMLALVVEWMSRRLRGVR